MVLILSFGCTGTPNQPNIELRKQIQSMQAQIADLQRQHDADVATIRSLQQKIGTVPTLPQAELDKLFTVHGIEFGRLTGEANWDPNNPGDEGLKVYVVPIDDAGQPLKAAGSFVIEVFDLAKKSDNLVSKYKFEIDDAKKNWFGHALLYTYVFSCPWQHPPQHHDLTLRVTFHDELTQREFEAQKVISVRVR
ncbi:MAG TPA: hypothetical protein VKK61_06295 [Tepidisphaeraceae bacterium]|nr:hypothetical protein [Tepidisphaeraceae bacterium]